MGIGDLVEAWWTLRVSAPHSRVSPRLTPPLISLTRQIPTPQPYFIFHLATFLVEDLIKYLDPEYIDRIAIPDASKLQFILAGSAGQYVHMHLGMWIVGEVGHRDSFPARPLLDTALEAAFWNLAWFWTEAGGGPVVL